MPDAILFLAANDNLGGPIAESLARHLLPPETVVASASVQAALADTRAVSALAAWGIDCRYAPRDVASLNLTQYSLVVCLSAEAARLCSAIPPGKLEQWNFGATKTAGDGASELRNALFEKISGLAQRFPVEPALGIIGGSGFYNLPGVEEIREVEVETPFGAPSDKLFVGRLHGRKVVFLPRHGRTHHLLPGEVNAPANLYALKRMGVTRVLSVSAVGSLREQIAPGHVVFPRQFIDRTLGRASTFFGGGVVAHVSLADPICNGLASRVVACAKQEPGAVHEDGTYLCMEGPQFSTRAESHMYRSWGADVIGMTNATEAKVAREAGICYATMAFPTDYDCWRTATEEAKVEEIIAVLRANVAKGQRIVSAAIDALDPTAPCSCHRALDTGLMTPREAIQIDARFRLHAILGAIGALPVG